MKEGPSPSCLKPDQQNNKRLSSASLEIQPEQSRATAMNQIRKGDDVGRMHHAYPPLVQQPCQSTRDLASQTFNNLIFRALRQYLRQFQVVRKTQIERQPVPGLDSLI